MKLKKSWVAPVFVLGVAVISGGWLLQRGVDQQQNVYFQVRLFEEVVDRVANQYVESVGKGELYQEAIDGLLEQLGDPNTSFITADDYEDFRIRTTGDYGGVGLEITSRDNWITVTSPIPGGPGERAGIKPGDQFFEIGGKSAEGWTTEQAVDALRGKAGASIDVKMMRPGVPQPIPFTLKREDIHLKAVPFASMLESGIVYVPLRIFRETSSSEVRAAIESLKRQQPVKGIVLDLRGNPGGLLEEGIGVANLFLPDGASVVETRGRTAGENQKFAAQVREAFEGIPVVVLVDGSSASASEIVAGALQDHDRALVVGMPSYGKGSVQTLFQLSGGNVLRLTTARWYTPVGRSIQKDHPDGEPAPIGSLTLDGRLVAHPDTAQRPTFKSDGGRTVFGGGGITPDLVVFPDTLSLVEQGAVQDLYRQAGALERAFFNYAVRRIQSSPNLPRNFELQPGDLQTFATSLQESDMQVDPATLRGAERFLRYRLTREIALQAWGEQGAFERVRQFDTQLVSALGVLRGATAPKDVYKAPGVQH
jgi:carboxyl-terminal processing protease